MTEEQKVLPLGDKTQEKVPFTRDTQLVGYLPLPKTLFHLGLSPWALLVYALLLDRGKLSQRSGWTDREGRVFVIYRVRDLALTLEKSESTIKRCLRELEAQDLIFRTLPLRGEAGWIFLRVPVYAVAGQREKALGLPPPKPIRRDPWEEPAWTPRGKEPSSPVDESTLDSLSYLETLCRKDPHFSTAQVTGDRGSPVEGDRSYLTGGGVRVGP